MTVCVSEVDEVFVQFELEFFYYTGIDGDSYFIVTAHDSGAGMTAVSANPTFVAFAPVPSLIEITGYAETFVVACDSIARIIGGCLGYNGMLVQEVGNTRSAQISFVFSQHSTCPVSKALQSRRSVD